MSSEKSIEAPDTAENVPPLETSPERSINREEDLRVEKDHAHLIGLRRIAVTLGLCLSVLLATFEIPGVSTSLVSITTEFGGYGKSSWIISVYLLANTIFMIILAKLSDVYGRKTLLLSSVLIFTIFSGACGAAQSMNQIIILRAFQGAGASGIYSLSTVVAFEAVPTTKYPLFSTIILLMYATGHTLGSLFGGLINSSSTWRWVFLLNVPGGAASFIILALALPNGFPRHHLPYRKTDSGLRKLDFLGALLMLVSLTLLVTALEQASNFVPWVSGLVLGPLVSFVPALVALGFWERFLTMRAGVQEPVLPWRFFQDRLIVGALAATFFVGAVFTICVIQIPVRFQAINGEAPFQAGVRLVPFNVAMPVGAALGSIIAGKRRVPALFIMLFGTVLEIVSLVFLARISLESAGWAGQYGFQVLTGLGAGLIASLTTLIMPFVVEKRDLAVATAIITQMRLLGGAVALAISTAAMNTQVLSDLQGVLDSAKTQTLLQSVENIELFGEPTRDILREVFLRGFNLQMYIALGFAAVQVPLLLLMWRTPQVRID